MRPDIERTTILDTVASTSAFRRQPADKGRAGSVRIVPPGVDEPGYRVDVAAAPSLANVAVDVLTQSNSVDQLEILSWSGEDHQEHLLTPTLRSEQPSARNAKLPTDAQPLAEATVEGRLGTAQSSIYEALNRHLPDAYGLETAALDFAPVGRTPVPTSRLLLKDRHDVIPGNVLQREPLPATIQALARSGQPHILQTLIKRNGGSGAQFLLSHRLAVFDPETLATSQDDYLDILEYGRTYDLAASWPRASFSSNYQFPIGDFIRQTLSSIQLEEAKYKEISASRRAWKLFKGIKEYNYLLAAQMGADPLYEDQLGYPRFPVSDADLRRFCAAVPMYYDQSIWSGSHGRRPPRITTDTVLTDAPGTDQSVGTGDIAVPSTDSDVANTGTPPHVSLLSFAVRALTEEGYEAWEVDQDTESRPDAELTTEHGTTRNIEVEVGDVQKPANILVNNLRATQDDRPVMHVTDDRQDADRVHDILRQPFSQVAENGAVLYNWTTSIEFEDGTIPVLPRGETQSTWTLTIDGDVELTADDEVLASGPADAPVSTYEFDSPRYTQQEELHCIVDDEGTILESAPTRAGVLEDWTQIRVPLVPADIHCLNDTTIRYKTGNTLTQLDATPNWVHDSETKRDIYRAAINEFLQHYTVAVDGAELRYDTFREVFNDWYSARLNLEDDDPSSAAGVHKSEIGKALPDHVERKSRDVDDTQRRFLKDRTLIYPPGLTSPELPFVDADEE